MKFGTQVVRDWGDGPKPRDGIGDVELSVSGNVVFRIGTEIAAGSESWTQTAHVVLTPVEWTMLVYRVQSLRAAQEIERAES